MTRDELTHIKTVDLEYLTTVLTPLLGAGLAEGMAKEIYGNLGACKALRFLQAQVDPSWVDFKPGDMK